MKKVKELFYSTELRMVISLLMALILLKLLVSDEFLEWPLELKAGLVVLFLLTALLNASYMEIWRKEGKSSMKILTWPSIYLSWLFPS
ncbi:Uncharacterised protein [Streptococcus sobrinus]|uniref:Uncharacterized protein n=1 Tax=Streptococcus sobrinus W1703 TaxID=1227275 RepID=U2KCJ1_9STRE|nr:hypothetical protein [Streptococcus sobrinus]ERJ74874.1 hypothetical protein HMPREF1557_01416 [Streptococcus sobrinus W1703]SQG19863.1 Uncharacterised protein [Streptococcus sobrinus]